MCDGGECTHICVNAQCVSGTHELEDIALSSKKTCFILFEFYMVILIVTF